MKKIANDRRPGGVLFFVLTVLLAGLFVTIAAPSLSGQERRDQWQKPEEVIETIGIKPGMIVGEVGAGQGYFTFKIAPHLGPSGRIYANDISRNALNRIRDRVGSEGLQNITVVRGEVEDPLFPEDNLDMVFMCHVYHDLEKPLAFMQNLKKYITRDTPVVIVEMDIEKLPRAKGHVPPLKTMIDQIESAGYELVRREDFLPQDAILIFKLS